MQITALELVANDANAISLGLRQPSVKEQYLAKAVYGLDAQEIIPKFYANGLDTGDKYYDFVMRPRELVMRTVLNPNYILNERAGDLRDELYKMISSNRNGELKIIMRNGTTAIGQLFGRVTKFEVPHFSKIQELQMTLVCEDPFIRAIADTELEEDLLGPGPSYEINSAVSTAPHGCVIVMEVTTNTTSFILTEQAADYDWKFQVSYSPGFQVGDIITISSVYNDKYVKFLRGVTETHIADRVTSGSQWPMLFPGVNTLYRNAQVKLTKVAYKNAFWGV